MHCVLALLGVHLAAWGQPSVQHRATPRRSTDRQRLHLDPSAPPQMTFTLSADKSLEESEALHTFSDPSSKGLNGGDESPSASQTAAEAEMGGKSLDTSVKL